MHITSIPSRIDGVGRPKSTKVCDEPDCDRKMAARGMCHRHYERWRATVGDAFVPIEPVNLMTRFWQYADTSGGPDACWTWGGDVHKSGYGSIYVHGGRPQLQKAHRFAYERLVGPIPDGMEVDHTCHTKECPTPGMGDPHRSCVNPRHLEVVDRPTNIRRSQAPEKTREMFAAITHCPQGHPYDEANTIWRKAKNKSGIYPARVCRTCHRNYVRAWREKRRQEARGEVSTIVPSYRQTG